MDNVTIQAAAVQSYIPAIMRARIHALFGVIFTVEGIVFQVLAGYRGQYLPYRIVALILGLFTLLCMLVLIWLPKEDN